mmetsp:Transcript_1725/g.3189  ORF Transcript_1725/g.3189 Transcript_1725/m.3189 type:complete len:88 (-) Transcript_1725:212-475(-)
MLKWSVVDRHVIDCSLSVQVVASHEGRIGPSNRIRLNPEDEGPPELRFPTRHLVFSLSVKTPSPLTSPDLDSFENLHPRNRLLHTKI